MRFQNLSPKRISLLVSVLLFLVITLVFSGVTFLFYQEFQIWGALTTGLVCAIITYFFILNVIEHFLFGKIKVIYKSIHKLKTKDLNDKIWDQIRTDSNALNKVGQEVMMWAEMQRNEINELKEQDQFRKEFIGNLAHELKTPIFNIQGYLSTLIDGGIEEPTIATKYLSNAEKNVARMTALVEDLDKINKLESNRISLNIEKVDLVAIAKEVLELSDLKANDKNISLSFKQHYDPIFVLADKNSIKQVFTNLMDNAILYGNKNGYVKIAFHDMEEQILTEVTDNGPGIEEVYLNRVFERFYRIDKSRSRNVGGSGLGLSIVKHILEAHQQSIQVRSTVGLGATFAFTLQKADV